MNTQSPELTQFYREYLAWVESGAPEKPAYEIAENIFFCRDAGLCYNLMEWPGGFNLRMEMHNQLMEELGVGCGGTPFNTDVQYYWDECNDAACHLNSRRIQWVKDHIPKEEIV